jgi:hypothetical protein
MRDLILAFVIGVASGTLAANLAWVVERRRQQ